VEYDPQQDIAVLSVDGLDLPYLRFDFEAESKQPAAVLGYPEDGPYDVQGARIRMQQRLRSPNIYGTGTVIRDVYSLRALIRPGNSGGPLVSTTGEVLGMIFAASVTDEDTGYALTAGQLRESAVEGSTTDGAADTGSCA
jgi:S1-C subfamily serine protease